MAKEFVVGSGCTCFIGPLRMLQGKLKLSRKGMSDSMVLDGVTVLAPTTGKTTLQIDSAIFAATPIDVMELDQMLRAEPTLVTISDKVNGTGRTMYAMLADDDEGFDEEKAGTYSVTLNCTDRKKI